jgi:hypothetical protein
MVYFSTIINTKWNHNKRKWWHTCFESIHIANFTYTKYLKIQYTYKKVTGMSSYNDLPFTNKSKLLNTLAQSQMCSWKTAFKVKRLGHLLFILPNFLNCHIWIYIFSHGSFLLWKCQKTACSVVKSLCKMKLSQYAEVINKNKINYKENLDYLQKKGSCIIKIPTLQRLTCTKNKYIFPFFVVTCHVHQLQNKTNVDAIVSILSYYY